MKKEKEKTIKAKCIFCGETSEIDEELFEKNLKLLQFNPNKEEIPQLICKFCRTINKFVKVQSTEAKKDNFIIKGFKLTNSFIKHNFTKITDFVAVIIANIIGSIIKNGWIPFFNNLIKDLIELLIFGYFYYINPKLEIGIFILVYMAIQKRCFVIHVGVKQ